MIGEGKNGDLNLETDERSFVFAAAAQRPHSKLFFSRANEIDPNFFLFSNPFCVNRMSATAYLIVKTLLSVLLSPSDDPTMVVNHNSARESGSAGYTPRLMTTRRAKREKKKNKKFSEVGRDLLVVFTVCRASVLVGWCQQNWQLNYGLRADFGVWRPFFTHLARLKALPCTDSRFQLDKRLFRNIFLSSAVAAVFVVVVDFELCFKWSCSQERDF